VTPTELLALLGRAWSRLLLFPGGLFAFAILWLLAQARRRAHAQGATNPTFTYRRAGWLGALIAPWLGLALLPLPPAPVLSRQTDLVVVLALLEVPLLVALGRELHAADAELRAVGRRRMAAALNAYPPLILAALALAQAAGSLEPATMARLPAASAPPAALALHWLGATAWVLALAPALGLGPFAPARAGGIQPNTLFKKNPNHQDTKAPAGSTPTILAAAGWFRSLGGDSVQIGLGLRQIGLVLLAALPPMAALGALDEGGLRTWRGLAGWALSPLVLALLLAGFDRATRAHAATRWAWAYVALDGVLLLALLLAALDGLRARLA
jgi:hypothetical protein